MIEAQAHLALLVSIRSQRTQQVIGFLRLLSDGGLRENVRFLPESWGAEDIAAFCLPVRVIDEHSYVSTIKKRAEANHRRRVNERTGDYMLATRQELLRDGERECTAIRPLEQVLGGHRHVILCGEPGEGKTTALWLHVATVCREFADRVERCEVGIDDLSFRLPLALPLEQLPGLEHREGKLADVFRQYLLGRCYEAGNAPLLVEKWLDEKIASRKFSICLDALDDLVSQESAGQCNGTRVESPREWLRKRMPHYGEVPVLLTTRFDAKDEDLLTVPIRYRMVCFGPRQVRDFIERYFQREDRGRALAEELTQRLRETPGPRHLAQLPLLLSILCRLKLQDPNEPLPPTRTKLLQRCLLAMMERGDERRGYRQRRTARNLKKLDELFAIARHCYGDEPVPIEETDLVKMLDLRRHRRSELPSADALLAEFKQDGILVPAGPMRYRFILRSFHEFCLAGSIAASDPAAVCREHARRVYLSDLDERGWKVLAPGWRHVWPLIAGQEPAHTEWLVGAIWPVSEESSHRDHVIAAAEVIHEAMNGKQDIPAGAASAVSWLYRAASIHQVAVAALGQIGSEASRSLLVSILQDADKLKPLRCEAAGALGQIGGEVSRKALTAVLQLPETAGGVRRECAEALGQIGYEGVTEVMAGILQEGQSSAQPGWGRWARTVGEAGHGILEADQAPDWPHQGCAAALGQIGGNVSVQILGSVLQHERTSEQTQWECAKALGNIGGDASREVLAAVLQKATIQESALWECARALGKLGEDASREWLAKILQLPTTSEPTRRECALALGRIGGEASRQVLVPLLQDEQTAPPTRHACARALGLIGGDTSHQLLLSLLRDKRTPDMTRQGCAEALGQIGGDASQSVLAAFLAMPEILEGTRRGCAWALGEIGGDPAQRVLRTVLDEEMTPERIRMECAAALGRIGSDAARDALASLLLNEQTLEPTAAACAAALGQIGCDASRNALAAALKCERTSESAREKCATMLGQIGGHAALDALIFVLREQKLSETVRWACTAAVREIGLVRAYQVLIGRARQPEAPDSFVQEAQEWSDVRLK